MSKKTLEVSEIYKSVVGEGNLIGRPCVKLRLYGNNIQVKNDPRAYSWDKNTNQKPGTEKKVMTIEEVIYELAKVGKGLESKVLIITGGEPLVQQEALIGLFNEIKKQKVKSPVIITETNGTIFPLKQYSEHSEFAVNIILSHKMNGTVNDTLCHRFKREVLESFTNAVFKFAIKLETELSEIEHIVKTAKLDKNKVIILPDVTNYVDIKAISTPIINYCISKNYRFGLKNQFILFGDKPST